jgi:D-cysteine desulfhydrase family pyridoxal phosphate-dependent enzyme
MQIGNIDRVRLGEFPTPLQELVNLSKELDGPRIFIKRDDLDGLGLGGNKLRKLEYAMAEAHAQRATAVITAGAVQSNHTRLTLAAANRLGLKTSLILKGKRPERATGNLLLDKILGALEINYIEIPESADPTEESQTIEEKVGQVKERLLANGERPYYIPNGCRPLHGALGYSGCVLEILTQLRGLKLAPDYILTACGSNSTQLGLILGANLYTGGEARVLGISISGHEKELKERIGQGLEEVMGFLGLKQFIESDIIVHDDYVGEGYGIPTDAMREAVQLTARKEGIILDPVYTGKAMAGLIDLIGKGKFERDEVVVFLHTGGVAGLFAEGQMGTFQG